MGKQSRQMREETRSSFRQFYSMTDRLHEMLRRMGEEQVPGHTVKMDEFERIRVSFEASAARYEKANHEIKGKNDALEEARLVIVMGESKKQMQEILRHMTEIVMRLNEKIKRQIKIAVKPNTTQKIRQSSDSIAEKQAEEKPEATALEKELQQKSLILYAFQKTFYKLMRTQRKEVNTIKKKIHHNHFNGLDDLRGNPQTANLLQEEDEDLELEEAEILEALMEVDAMIEERLDNILDGIKIINYNALNISNNLGLIRTKILINLDHVETTNKDLKKNTKKFEEAAEYASKPSCIMNVIILALLGLLGYLIARVFMQ